MMKNLLAKLFGWHTGGVIQKGKAEATQCDGDDLCICEKCCVGEFPPGGRLPYPPYMPVGSIRRTPSAKWRAEGKEDPHAGQYDCERGALPNGDMTDDELANAIFLDEPTTFLRHTAQVRIRWLSRKLEETLALLEKMSRHANLLDKTLDDVLTIGYLGGFKYKNERAVRLMKKGKPFIVVALDEPYFKEVYDKIRESEKAKNCWTDECELEYVRLTCPHDIYESVAHYLRSKPYASDCAARHTASVLGAPYGSPAQPELEDCPDEGCPHYGEAWCEPHPEWSGCISVLKEPSDV